MTAQELVTLAKDEDIHLVVHEHRLRVDAPKGAVTPELRDQFALHKAEILVLLEPVTAYVSLHGGLAVPLPALRLALDLEARGFELWVTADHQVVVAPAAELNAVDRAALQRWRGHLATIVAYDCVPN